MGVWVGYSWGELLSLVSLARSVGRSIDSDIFGFHLSPQEPKHCEGLSRKIVRQTATQLINGLEDEEEEGGGGGGGGAAALTPQSVTRAQCLSTLLANYR